ncbi:putative GTP-binding protein EngB [Frankliniella fusca]|uniref:GTP-binding protein EngB n=1 Tax=Frankliniella fusca TaxID=407009 RepID=A0AAE1GYD8_9NEOP|nr:putative GTP-binding protein EngB [Frankliniella fusca]
MGDRSEDGQAGIGFYALNGKRCKLFPHAVPSQNLPLRVHDKKLSSPLKRLKEGRAKRAELRNKRLKSQTDPNFGHNQEDNSCSDEPNDEPPQNFTVCCEISTQANLIDDRLENVRNEEDRSIANLLCEHSPTLDKTTQVNFLKLSNSDKPMVIPEKCEKITLAQLLDSNEKLCTFTGIHSLELLEGLVECASDIDIDAQTNKKILPLKDRVLITMVKLKLSLGFTAISVLYGVSRQTISNYFKHMVPILSRVLRVMVPWPDQESIRQNLPLSFKKYRNTRIILDCAETNLEKSKCLKCRILSYSQYKKNFTVKFNVGIAPSGLITEVSCPYGGRASDCHIVEDSKILDKLDYRDGVMTDKGYRIEKQCLERNLILIRPPFLSKKQQMSRADALATAEIARARVHVERVIQRLREFKVLKYTIPWRLAGYTEDILFIAAGLTNLGPPVIGTHRFM